MAEKDQHINHYTAQDIQRYLNKQMTQAEMYAFEKASLEDPFLAEALEGYIDTPVASLPADIDELKNRLIEKNKPERKVIFYKKIWWSAAASVLILFGAAVTWFWLKPSIGHDIAQQKTKEENAIVEKQEVPATAPVLQDSISIQIESSKSEAEKTGVITPQSATAPEEKKSQVHTDTNESLKKTEGSVDKSEIANFNLNDSLKPEREDEIARTEVTSSNKQIAKEYSDNSRKVAASRNAAPSIPAYIFKGKITDSHSKPLPFVNLNIPGTGSYTYTDANGNFSIMSGDTQMVVHVKSVGFKPENFTLQSNIASNNITLKTNTDNLSDVVIVGYGTQKKDKKQSAKNTDTEEEIAAEPVDGWGNYDIYLLNNERVTAQGIKTLTGLVELSFVVNQYGHLTDFNILKSTCTACEKEAIRLIKEGPKWKLINGTTPAKVEVTLHF